MADVKWIKIATGMFDNKKIKKIRRTPEGNNIIVIWVYLLVKAGESNNFGGLFLTDTIPYTLQDISEDAEFSIDVVKLAISILEKYNMIEIYDDVLYIKNWSEYQNIEGLDKIREQGRIRVERFRNKQKLIECNVTSNATVTECNAIEEEVEVDKEKIKSKPQRHKYGEYKNVLLSDEQMDKLKNEFPDYLERIENLSEYVASTGKTYKDHLATIRSWSKKDKSPTKTKKAVMPKEVYAEQ